MDEKTGKVGTVVGKDYAKVLGMGLVDKDVKDLTEADIDLIKLNLPEQIKKAKKFNPKAGFMRADLPYEILKNVAKGVPTPAGTIALTGAFGLDPSSSLDRASVGVEAALAPELVKQSARFSPAVQRALNLGLSPAIAARAARIASPIGIASLGAEGVYQLYKAGQ